MPAIPIAALTLPLYIIVPTFYSETLGLSLAAVGGAIIAVRIIDAVTDPVIGWLSDRWRPPFGRRRTFFVVALLPAAISCVMLFWPPEKPTALYLAFWGAALSMGFTAMQLSYTAWGAELAGNYRVRSRIAGYREAFTLIGTLIAIALPFAIGIDRGGLHGLAVLGFVVAVCLFLFGGLAVANVPEPREYTVSKVKILEGLRHMARNGPFVRLIAAYFVNGLANGIPATLFLYFVAQRLDAADMRGPLLFIYFLAGLFGVPLTLRLAERLGKHRAWCYAMLFNAALFALVSLLGAGDAYLFRRDLLRHGAHCRRRSRSALGDPGRRHRRRHGALRRAALRPLFRDLEPVDQAVAGGRRRHRLPAARAVRLRSGAGRRERERRRLPHWPRSMSGAGRAEARGDCADVEFSARRARTGRVAQGDRDARMK